MNKYKPQAKSNITQCYVLEHEERSLQSENKPGSY